MEAHRHAECALGRADACDVIDVGVGEQDVTDRKRFPIDKREQRGDLVSRVDQHRFPRALARDHEPVLEEWADGLRFNYDHGVILAILDDLMFTSKIKTAATQLGVPIVFARSSQSALADMRKNAPALVILDLNNPRVDPLGTVASMKADASLAAIPTVGYVSHVHTDLIAAAREAGVGEVLARSTFAERLPEILARGR